MEMRDRNVTDKDLDPRIREAWKEHGILRQHVRFVSLRDYYCMSDQIESDARVKSMIGFKEFPYVITVGLKGGVVEELFDVKEWSDVRMSIFVFESESKKAEYLDLSVTRTHDIHRLSQERTNTIKARKWKTS